MQSRFSSWLALGALAIALAGFLSLDPASAQPRPCNPPRERDFAGNCVERCPPGQVRNSKTNRCEPTSTARPCNPPNERDYSGACVPPCPGGQKRNPSTNKCERHG